MMQKGGELKKRGSLIVKLWVGGRIGMGCSTAFSMCVFPRFSFISLHFSLFHFLSELRNALQSSVDALKWSEGERDERHASLVDVRQGEKRCWVASMVW